jgi:general secretion pathway protein G
MKHEKPVILRSEKGFTLIEIMVVVVILGILAGLVVPRFLDEPDKAKKTKAVTDIRGIEQALNMFKLENGFYPTTDQGLQALVTKPEVGRIPTRYKEGGYLKRLPQDPWGNPYIYLSPGLNGEIDIISYGPDGERGGEGKNADINSWEID